MVLDTQQPHDQHWSTSASAAGQLAGASSRQCEETGATHSPCSTSSADFSPKSAKSADGDARVYIPTTCPISIYGLYSQRRRNTILLAAAFTSILVPFCDTIYLPALAVIQSDLNTSAELVAASVSIYMFVVGVAALVWGPASDKFGRMPTYMIATVAYLGATLGCVFAHTAEVLVLFRALQGAGVAAFMTTGAGVIADIFPPEGRGTASGIFMVPLLIGPVLGPVLGGALSQAWGWRSTFIALAAFAAVAGLVIVSLIRTETHQYFVLKKLAKSDPEGAKGLQEWDSVTSSPPVFSGPWVPLRYLVEPSVWPHALVALVTFSTGFGVLTELPGALAHAPYSLPAGLLGIAYLADGIPGLVGSPLGGILSDRSAAQHPTEPEARLAHNTLIALITMPSGLLIYAWALHMKTHLVGVFAGMVLTSFGCALYLPGLFGFLTTMKQSAAGAASAAVQSMMFIMAGVIILVSAVATRTMGYGPWFSLLAGIQVVVTAFAYVGILRKQRVAAAAAAAAMRGSSHELSARSPSV